MHLHLYSGPQRLTYELDLGEEMLQSIKQELFDMEVGHGISVWVWWLYCLAFPLRHVLIQWLVQISETVEAGIVQLFIASIISHLHTFTVRLVCYCSRDSSSTLRSKLNTLSFLDLILLLVFVDGNLVPLVHNVRAWLSATRENRINLLLERSAMLSSNLCWTTFSKD